MPVPTGVVARIAKCLTSRGLEPPPPGDRQSGGAPAREGVVVLFVQIGALWPEPQHPCGFPAVAIGPRQSSCPPAMLVDAVHDEMKAISGLHALLTNIVLAWTPPGCTVWSGGSSATRSKSKTNGCVGSAPAHFSHINFRGTMRFDVEKFAAALIQRAPGQAARMVS